MKRIVELGVLGKGRVFYFNGKKFKVAQNLGEAGVAVTSESTRAVRIEGREFEAKDKKEQVWSAASEVEIEVRR